MFPTVALAEVADFARGLTYTKSDEVDFSSNIVLRANNVDLNSGTIIYEDLKYLRDAFFIPNEKKVKAGSLIICTASGSKSHLGKVALIPEGIDMAFGGFMGMLSPREGLDGRFLYFALRSPIYMDFIAKVTDGANINNLKFSDLGLFEFPLPPLDEQKRIVAKLDAAQQEFDRLSNHLEQQLIQLADFDNALLSDMLGDPHETPEPAMSRKGSSVFLGDIVNVQGGYAFKSGEYTDSGHYLIRIANVIDNQVIQTDDKYVDLESEPNLKRFEIEVGDLLMTLTGNIGRTAIVTPGVLPAALNQRVARIQADKKVTSNEFLQYLFNSDAFIQHILSAGHGAAQQNVSTKDLESFQFSLPTLDDQKRIVAKLHEVSLASSSLRSNVLDRRKSASELQSSILTAAFAGAL